MSIPQKNTEPDILEHICFDGLKEGKLYGPLDVRRDFGSAKSIGTFFPFARVRVAKRDDSGGTVLKVKYPKGKVRSLRSGASWHWSTFEPCKDLYLSYCVKFRKDFVFRAGGKLHGFLGGEGNTGGKKPNGHDGWSSRVHWGPNNKIKQYVYHKDQKSDYGHVFYWVKHPKMRSIDSTDVSDKFDDDFVTLIPDKWYYIVTRVVLNDVGQHNGFVQSWINGRLAVNVHGFEFRDQSCSENDLLIDKVYFSTFFGGNDDSFKPVRDEYAYFDDFRISTTLPSLPNMLCQEVADGLYLKPPKPLRFKGIVDNTTKKYGYGMRLEWITPCTLNPTFYQIEYSTRSNAKQSEWISYASRRDAKHGSWINHHGTIEEGDYCKCLPSGQKLYYRVRALDKNGKALTAWSNVATGRVDEYKIVMLVPKPRLFLGKVGDLEKQYGYGIRLEWKIPAHLSPVYYQIQYTTTNPSLSEPLWRSYQYPRKAVYGPWVNHLGSIEFENFVNCLPSGKTYYYRVRALNESRKPISSWSNVESARVKDYALNESIY